MTRTMKEIIRKLADEDIEGVCRIAKQAGYTIECYDGDGECGMCEPILNVTRKNLYLPTGAAKSRRGTSAVKL